MGVVAVGASTTGTEGSTTGTEGSTTGTEVSTTGAGSTAVAGWDCLALAVATGGGATADVATWTTSFGSVTVTVRVASVGAEPPSVGVRVTSKLLPPRPER